MLPTMGRMDRPGPASLSARLHQRVVAAIADAGGWLPFDRLMAIALYEPGLGYYTRGSRQFGAMPASGSDFVTAPELSPLFGQALARQVGQALDAAGSGEVIEFGAGSGALAFQLLSTLGDRVDSYSIVDLSATLRERQAAALSRWGDRVRWLDAWPDRIAGVVVGNEVLDAMPVQLLHYDRRMLVRTRRRVVGVVVAAGLGRPRDRTATTGARALVRRHRHRDPSAVPRPGSAAWPTGCSAARPS